MGVETPWAAEHVVSADLAIRLFGTSFPSLGRLRAQPFGRGWDNSLVNDTWVSRFPRLEIAAALILVRTECTTLPGIAGALPVPIPFPRWIGEPTDEFPWTSSLTTTCPRMIVHGDLETPPSPPRTIREDALARLADCPRNATAAWIKSMTFARSTT